MGRRRQDAVIALPMAARLASAVWAPLLTLGSLTFHRNPASAVPFQDRIQSEALGVWARGLECLAEVEYKRA